MARTALITGIFGQDGSLLAELLLSRGYQVVGVARPGAANSSYPELADVRVVTVDLEDPVAVRALLDSWQPDEIYHLAAFHHASQDASVSAALAGKESMLATNFLSTRTLAFTLAAAKSTCHLVYAASSQMYTAGGMTDDIDEQTCRRPSTFYGHTKSWSMDLLASLRTDANLVASTAILFNHESPRRRAQFVSRKITMAAAQAAKGLRPALSLYNLATRVDWSSAQDVVKALALMGQSKAPSDYVVASGVLHSVRDLLEVAFSHLHLDWREFTTVQEDRPTPGLRGCARSLRERLGWQPASTFEDMVVDMVCHDVAQAAAVG